MKSSSTKLINLLIGKSILDTVLVGTLAVGFYINVFPPHFHGWGEATRMERVTAGGAIAPRAERYGLPGVMVDGNDPLAVNARRHRTSSSSSPSPFGRG